MSYLFYIDEKNLTVLRPECYKLSPELSVLSERDILFVVLSTDYHSIYRQFPEHERVRKAMFHAYDKYDPEILKKPSMKLAIEAYKGLQYDPKIHLAERYQKKIDRLLEILDVEDSATAIEKNTKAIDSLRKNIIELENEVAESIIKKGQVKGDQELGWIEALKTNKKHYASLKKE
jgi:hypothetical protein